jgi:uncharacterized membrane protein
LSLAPLLAAAPVIQAHATAAILAVVCSLGVTFLAKGTPMHVWTGRVYALAMMLAAATSFWITGLRPGQFSWIHILSVVTLIAIPLAIYAIRRGDRRSHAIVMSCNVLGLLIAGAFTLLPPRIMHAVVFGP